MSKIRIYELARELGVDNKVIINKAIEFGMEGKSSHSNSLDSDEADQIRRAVIRQAMGTSAQAPAAPTEVVTTRVDRMTGATEAIVEKRSGNVIRRRKAPEAQLEQVADMEPEAAQEPEESNGVPYAHEPAHARSDYVEEQAEIESEEVVEAEAAESSAEPEAVAERPDSAAPSQSEPAEKAASAPAVVEEEDTKKKTVGPKVLGKIELPAARRPVRPEAREARQPAAPAAAVEISDEEEGEKGGDRNKKAKKTKKREISRVDLVDYEGRDSKRMPRVGHRGGHGRDSSDIEAKRAQLEATKPKQSKRVVKIDEVITVGELAKQMSLKVGEVISKLIELGVMATINQMIDQDIATIVAEEFGFQLESTSFNETQILEEEKDDPALMRPRPPIVTVMGHVDHGKTSLLDAIRHSSVANKEHGGITQHIGAYKVILEDQRSITFIDTPGHAAFTSMRARGAHVTDIVILVVAADDGVMPQTIEAVNHAKAAGVPIIVAVNKIDRPDANPDKAKQQLLEHGLQPEEWGGETLYFNVSATKRTGIQELLEGILLQAEVKELKANPDKRAKGVIIEAKQERGLGTVATVLVREGTLRLGDIFVTGSESGRVRSLLDHNGEKIDAAGPSTPVEITGISGVPMAGDDFASVESESQAREIAANRSAKRAAREEKAFGGPISLEEFARRANNMAAAELNVILKADVHGSVEAVRQSIEQLSTDKVRVKVLHAAVGGVTESDVQLAIASKAIIVGFGVRAEPRAVADAERSGVQIRFYRIIYELIDDVKSAMIGLLDPVKQEVPLGRIEIRETFSVPKIGTVAGCFVVDGMVKRGAFVRLLRDSRLVYEGKMSSLRRFKDDVKEVQSGYECGIGLENFNDVKSGDTLEVFEIKEIAPTLN